MGDAYDDMDAGRPEPHRCPDFHASPTLPEPRLRILDAVAKERLRQIGLGWTPEHDHQHGLQAFVNLSATQVQKATTPEADGYFSRTRLIEAIALLVAGVEMMDAKERAGRFDGTSGPDWRTS